MVVTRGTIMGGIAKAGAKDVYLLDKTSPAMDLYFIQSKTEPVNLAVDAEIDDHEITVVSAAGMSIGDYLGMSQDIVERFYFGEILNIAGNVITLDTPIDYPFSAAGTQAFAATRDLNVVASAGSPQIFDVRTVPVTGDLVVDITRINISIVCAAQPDDGLFGNLPVLTNGIVFRRVDGDTRNIWNVKSNADLAILSGIDLTYSARSVPQGSFGVKCRITYAGQEKHGTILRINPGDFLQLIIRDDLSSLLSFRVMAQGHIEERR